MLISGRLPNQQKTFQEENAGGKPDPRQAEIIWSGFKLVCPKYSLTCVVYVSNGTSLATSFPRTPLCLSSA